MVSLISTLMIKILFITHNNIYQSLSYPGIGYILTKCSQLNSKKHQKILICSELSKLVY